MAELERAESLKPTFFARLRHALLKLWQRWWHGLLGLFWTPRPDFYHLLGEHAARVHEAVAALQEWMVDRDVAAEAQVAISERAADQLMEAIDDQLDKALSAPMDREDIHDLSSELDEVADYAKATLREMQILEVSSDQFTTEMVALLVNGTDLLRSSIYHLAHDPRTARQQARAVRKIENQVEMIYRSGLHTLFQDPDIIQVLKHREVYRHLSNAADKLERVAYLVTRIATKRM